MPNKKSPRAKKQQEVPDAIVKADATVIEADELVISRMQPGLEVEANFEALETHIERILSDYRGTIVTRDYVTQAKKDRAFLNNLTKSLDQRRKDVKERYLAPVAAFENRVKQLIAPIKEASVAIDEQVKAIEEQEKADKRALLRDHYECFAGVLAEAVAFERIEKVEWLNRSFNEMKARGEIEQIILKIVDEEKALTDLDLPHSEDAKAEYFATLDMAKAIARSKAIEQQLENARQVEAQKQAYQEQQAQAARETPVETPPASAPAESAAPARAITEECEEPNVAWTIEVSCTRTQLGVIVAHLRAMGLTGRARR